MNIYRNDDIDIDEVINRFARLPRILYYKNTHYFILPKN